MLLFYTTNINRLNIFRGTGSFLKSLFLFLLFFIANKSFSQTTITNTYSTPGNYTFTVPYGVTSITVELWGGGGAGGGATTTSQIFTTTTSRGGGGGGGAYNKVILSGLTVGTTYSLTVGAGGTAELGANGNDGGNSIFNTVQIANGGKGGTTVSNGNGLGGARGAAGTYRGGNGASATNSGSGGGGGGAGSGSAGSDGGVTTGGSGGSGGGGIGGDGKTANNDGSDGSTLGGGGGGGYYSGFWSSGTKSGGNGGDGQIIITFTMNCSTQNVWLGSTNTNWNRASNWCSGVVPTSSTDVYIPPVGSVPNQPNINATGAVCRNITIDGTLNGNTRNLDVYGDWVNNGSYTATSGSITFRGATNSLLAGSAATSFANLIVNKSSTSDTLTSTTNAFSTLSALTVTKGNLVLQATNDNYNIGGNLTIPAAGVLTHGVNWDTYGKSLNITGNIAIDGIYTYSVARATVRMVGTGSKSVRTGTNSGSAFSIFLLEDGTYSASGTILIKDNFWPMFGTTGSFSTSGQTVTANASILMNNGSVNVNGGTLNITGGLQIGFGTTATLNLSSGTINADNILVGSTATGVFNFSGGTLNVGNVIIGNGVTGTFTCTTSPVMNVTGNWTNNGTFTPATGQVNFAGSATQTVGGTTATTFYNASKTTNQNLTLNKNVTVSNTLTFNTGSDVNDLIDINGQVLTIKTLATNPNLFKGSTTSDLIFTTTSGTIPALNFVSGYQNLRNLTLTRAASLGTPVTINNSLSLTTSLFTLGSNDLTFTPTATVTGATLAATNMIVADATTPVNSGKVVKQFSGIGSFLYPIGDVTGTDEYTPVTLTFNSGTFGPNASVGFNLVNLKHPNNTSPTDYFIRYYNVSSTDIANYKATSVLSYTGADTKGNLANIYTAAYNPNDGSWTKEDPNTYQVVDETNLNRSYTGANFAPTVAASYFRTISNGNWSTISNWQSSTDNITWVPSSLVPTSLASAINILSGHIDTISTAITLGKTQINGTLSLVTGGKITLANATDALTINNGGVFNVTTTAAYGASTFVPGTTGRVTVNTGGKITVGDGVTVTGPDYEYLAQNTSNNVWHAGAVFEWNNQARVFRNLTYFSLLSSEIPVFRITKISAQTANITAIYGLLEVNTPFNLAVDPTNTVFRNGITSNNRSTLTQQSGGSFRITADGSLLNNVKLTLNGSGLSIEGNTTSADSIDILGTQNVSVSSGKTLTINGVFNLADKVISGAGGKVTVGSTGKYRTSHAGGFSGSGSSLTATGTISLQPGSTVELYASGNQTLNSRTDFSKLIFSGSGTKTISGVTFPIDSVAINGVTVSVLSSSDLGGATTNLTMTGSSRLIVDKSALQPSMGGTYNLTGGVIEFKGSVGQTIRGTGITYNQIEVSGAGVSNTTQDITLKSGGKFTISNGGVYTANDNNNTITGSGSSVIVLNGGTFNTANAAGLNGGSTTSIHSSITTIDLQTGSTVNYNKSGAQTITIPNVTGYSNLILSGTGNKTAPAGDLNILGDFSKTSAAVFVHNSGTVVFKGSAAQNIYNTAAPEIVFNNFTNNNTVGLNIQDSISVYRKLTLGTTSKLTLNRNITFKSDTLNTANLGEVPSDATITYGTNGRFIVERYLPNHKAWHFLSVPTKGSTFKSAWQENNDSLLNTTKPGYGIMLTGTDTTVGYDYKSPQPSLKYFDNTAYKYIEVRNTDTTMASLGGYMVFIKGDRSVLPTSNGSSSTTLRTKGKIYAPGAEAPTTITVKKDSFALIGNPYPSAIDFDKLTSTHMQATYYVWDPNLTTGYGYGAFQSINGGIANPGGGLYDGVIPYIQSGQSFFVQAEELNNGTVSIPETAKVDANTTGVLRTGITNKISDLAPTDAQIRVRLYRISGNNSYLVDGAISLFSDSYIESIDKWDATKLTNIGTENMGIRSNGKVLAIERKQLPQSNDTIFYKMNNYKIAPYRFVFITKKLDVSGQDAFLYDKFLNTFTPLTSNDTTEYNFSIAASPVGSWDENRFSIVFRTSVTTPVTLTNVKAYTKNKDIVVEWNVENESNMRSYTVETSIDGKTFIRGGTVAAKNVAITAYQWLDKDVTPGYHYYRILSTELDGKSNYSKIVRVLVGNNSGNPTITIYPNPIKDGVINLQFENQEAGVYQVRLLNTVGQVIINKTITYPGGSSSELLQLNNTITKGVYTLEITKGGVRVMSEKMVY